MGPRHGETTVVGMSQDSTGGGFRGFRDTAQVDMPMAPPHRTGPIPGRGVGAATRTESRPAPVPEPRIQASAPIPILQLSEGLAGGERARIPEAGDRVVQGQHWDARARIGEGGIPR